MQRIKLEVDARNVWKSISEGEQDRSYGGNILRVIFVYSSSFFNFKCNFMPRQYNLVADTLEKCRKGLLVRDLVRSTT